MDNFEKYIKDNRERLDNRKPDMERMWSVISEQTEKPRKSNNILRFTRYAASLVVAFLSVWYIINVSDKDIEDDRYVLMAFSQEYAQRESEYLNQIESLNKKIESLSNKNIEIVFFLKNELKNVDVIYKEAVADIGRLGKTDRIADTICDTYEKRLHILEKIINEIQKHKSYEKQYAQTTE